MVRHGRPMPSWLHGLRVHGGPAAMLALANEAGDLPERGTHRCSRHHQIRAQPCGVPMSRRVALLAAAALTAPSLLLLTAGPSSGQTTRQSSSPSDGQSRASRPVQRSVQTPTHRRLDCRESAGLPGDPGDPDRQPDDRGRRGGHGRDLGARGSGVGQGRPRPDPLPGAVGGVDARVHRRRTCQRERAGRRHA